MALHSVSCCCCTPWACRLFSKIHMQIWYLILSLSALVKYCAFHPSMPTHWTVFSFQVVWLQRSDVLWIIIARGIPFCLTKSLATIIFMPMPALVRIRAKVWKGSYMDAYRFTFQTLAPGMEGRAGGCSPVSNSSKQPHAECIAVAHTGSHHDVEQLWPTVPL